MMQIETVVALFPDLDTAELMGWVERHWVQPDTNADEAWIFTEIDVARVRLIYDLRRDLDVAEEAISMMLALLDQLYDLRRTAKAMNRAIAAQPSEVQDAIRAALNEGDEV